jgi:exonuclease SbcC
VIPTKLKLSNFLSYGSAELDLADLRCAVITGGNGHGKSSIIDALTFALFGEARGRVKDDIIKLGTDVTHVILELSIGGKNYRINRSVSRGGKSLCNLEECRARVIDNADKALTASGKWVSIAGSSINDTNKRIEDLLHMNLKTLRNAAFALQGASAEFSKADPAERKRVLADILDLDMWQAACESVKERGKALRAEISAREGMIEASRVTDDVMGQAQESASLTEKAASEATRRLDAIETAYGQKREEMAEASAVQARFADLKVEFERVQKATDIAQNDLNALAFKKLSLQEGQLMRTGFETGVKLFEEAERDYEAYRQTGAKCHELTAQLRELEQEANEWARDVLAREGELQAKKSRLDAEHEHVKAQADTLSDLPCAGTDMQQSCRLLKGAVEAAGRLESLEDERYNVGWQLEQTSVEKEAGFANELDIERIKAEIAESGYDPAHESELRAVRDSRAGASDNLRRLDLDLKELEGLEAQVREKETRLEELRVDYTAKYTELQSLEAAVSNAEALSTQAQTMEAELRERRKDHEDAVRRHASAQALVSSLMEKRKQTEAWEAELAGKRKAVESDAELATMLGRNGVQALLMDRAIPSIEADANAVLARIKPGLQVALSTQRANQTGTVRETLDIIISDEEGTRPYESFSGGESFRVDFALRIALSKLLTRRAGARLETLVVDEGFGSLDSDGVSRMVECLNAIKDDFKLVLVVSHLEDMKDAFPARIEVAKNGGGSTAKVVYS